jgi:aryl sulfotransferase
MTSDGQQHIKTRDIQSRYMKSTHWDGLALRPDDILIATCVKSGTTWMQQIVSQLIFDGAEGLDIESLSKWVDAYDRSPEDMTALAAQSHRRFMKTHLPADALTISPTVKYIYVARDGRDVAWSAHNHHYNATDDYFAGLNARPLELGPRLERGTPDPREFFAKWLAEDGYPFWPFWDSVRSWWSLRKLPNVLLVHFNALKVDLSGSVARIARFLDISPAPAAMERILSHSSFAYMKAHAKQMAPNAGGDIQLWNGGAATFINKGTNGRWRDVLSAEEIADYEARALAELGPDCAAWLAGG